ncbi:hypothetical protein PIB30_063670 [Stylosanthes scabra]|uniref:Uncharacterized protein n=1 Tax=Stylosanthes scabra TaxID=79078 RepID=A0ABU6RLS5_9FABA|nr:hypothetical protein [Stylosanthes scabra]
MVLSCDLTCPWEHFGIHFANTCVTHGPIARPRGCEVNVAFLLTGRPRGVPRDRTVPSGRIKIKVKNGISSLRARSKALARPNSIYMKKGQLKHKGRIPIRIILDFRIVLRERFRYHFHNWFGFRYNEPLVLNDKEFRTDLDCDTRIGLSLVMRASGST